MRAKDYIIWNTLSPNITSNPQYIHSQISLLLFIYEGSPQTKWLSNISK